MLNDLEVFFSELQKRAVIANVANLENHFYHLKPNEKVIYWGIDCTAESLHIGHLFLLIQVIRFAKAGFTVLLVLGGATSKIGDPSDKNEERPLLKEAKIADYQAKIKSQLERILIKPEKRAKIDFSPAEQFYSDNPKLLNDIYEILKINGKEEKEKQWKDYLQYIWPLKENPNFQILNNRDWLEKINLIDFLRQTGKYLTIAYLSSKETIKKRIDTGLSFLEFSYPLIQAYDFYYLHQEYNCQGQLGGSDQWGNLTTGLKLIKSLHSAKKIAERRNKTFAFNFPLLTDPAGKKYSKSGAGAVIWLDDKPANQKVFFDFFRNLPDQQAKIYLQQFTFLSDEQINQLLKLNNPPKLRLPQRILTELLFYLLYRTKGEGLNWLSEKLKIL